MLRANGCYFKYFAIFTYVPSKLTTSKLKNSVHLFLSVRISSYSWLSVRSFFMTICENLFYSWLSVIIFFYLFSLIHTYFYLWELMRIFLNPSYPWESLLIYDHLWEFFSTSFAFYSLYESKQAYEYHYLNQIFYHQNMIMISCWLRIFQFHVFYFEFFSFCVWLPCY